MWPHIPSGKPYDLSDAPARHAALPPPLFPSPTEATPQPNPNYALWTTLTKPDGRAPCECPPAAPPQCVRQGSTREAPPPAITRSFCSSRSTNSGHLHLSNLDPQHPLQLQPPPPPQRRGPARVVWSIRGHSTARSRAIRRVGSHSQMFRLRSTLFVHGGWGGRWRVERTGLPGYACSYKVTVSRMRRLSKSIDAVCGSSEHGGSENSGWLMLLEGEACMGNV